MRQELKFRNFKDVREALTRLSQGEVETLGLWSYYQTLTHCATTVENSMKGLKREMSWWKRHVIGPLFFIFITTQGALPRGIRGNPQNALNQRVEGDEKAALSRLLKALEDFEKFGGTLNDHPLLGTLTKKKWFLFHSLHLANHLGYARLKEGP